MIRYSGVKMRSFLMMMTVVIMIMMHGKGFLQRNLQPNIQRKQRGNVTLQLQS